MSPKEKAEELIEKMHTIDIDDAKQCTLIAVDEIINVLYEDINPLINYWLDVKQEIEKL
jgi:hypothetical protein